VKKAVKKTVTKKTKKPAKKAQKKVVKKSAAKKTTKKPIKKVAKKASPKKSVKQLVIKNKVKKAVAAKPKKAATKFVAHQTSLKAGMLAPQFLGKDQNGNMISLDMYKGKTVILYFYPKDDTPGCTATACGFRDGYEHLSQLNYAIIGVSADDEKSHAKFAKKYNLPFPLLADTNLDLIKAYDVWGTKQFMGKIYDGIIRTTFIINPDGTIKEVITKVDTSAHTEQILGQ
jgi:thioredoxin-dependent peroxiredoxin